jgi:RimJ/RimL family protein N-acetyltransferase
VPDLYSKRLRFINSTPEILNKILAGNDALAAYLQINVPEKWTEFGEATFQYVIKQLKNDPDSAPWWSWLPVLIGENLLIGSCGYKGRPKDGTVEIGYEVIPEFRGIGLATEIAAVLADNAFNYPEVSHVIAHTLPHENASCKVLRKCGFKLVAEEVDPEDGAVWLWQLTQKE